jgi:hypothetical protein
MHAVVKERHNAMANDTLLPFDLPAAARKDVTAAFDFDRSRLSPSRRIDRQRSERVSFSAILCSPQHGEMRCGGHLVDRYRNTGAGAAGDLRAGILRFFLPQCELPELRGRAIPTPIPLPGAEPLKLTACGQAVKPSELPRSGRGYTVRRSARNNRGEIA